MTSRSLLALLLLLLSSTALAQSADQEMLSATDSPDPAVPGQDVTFTATVRNNGPDPAVNGGVNANLGNGLILQSMTGPAGFGCAAFGQSVSCTHPSFPVGDTAVVTIVARVSDGLISFPDGSINSNFFTSGVTPDPNNGNNAVGVNTSYDTPQIDMAMQVSDSPDPVGPNQNITYTATVTNAGPDTATDAIFSVFNNGTLLFQSVTPAPGFSCTPPAVGSAPQFVCNGAVVPPGTYEFQLVVRADGAVLGINDGTVATSFSTSGVGNDTNPSNNNETESTAYVTPDADVSITVDDFPDPALLGEHFEFLIAISNAGPDPTGTTTVSSFNPGTLRFVSIEAPIGYKCTTPSPGSAPTLSCSTASLAAGASDEFILAVDSSAAVLGQNGALVETIFTVQGSVSDPNNANNSESEFTTIRSALLFRDGFED